MQIQPRKLDKLKKRLQHALKQTNLHSHRNVIQQISGDLEIDVLDCAAGLLMLSQPHLFQPPNSASTHDSTAPSNTLPPVFKAAANRNVRYRLDIGTQHQIDQEQLLALLIEESGVDRKRITRTEMRDTYTLVDLPEGMPADIFQLLSEATLNGHALNIKRVKPNRKKFRDPRRGHNPST